ncbi:MAG: asparagine synthase (glutamine-hydrolyzing) [Anaerolineales bacterium]
MCGISAILGPGWNQEQLEAMMRSQRHRGPDASGVWMDRAAGVGLGHNRLSIIDLSPAGRQPMCNRDQTLWIVFNGEVYNYLELRAELCNYPYQTQTDTEVILAAYERWGEACLDHFIGMFALMIWDVRRQVLFAARDRFGVKPLYYSRLPDGAMALASEIKALHAAGLPRQPDSVTWATYLAYGVYGHSARTFWQGVQALPAGHALRWQAGQSTLWRWYDLAERVGNAFNQRSSDIVADEYLTLLEESVRMRFRSDVPVGINLSGGLDSSILLGLVHTIQGAESRVNAYTFATGDPAYDELPWVEQMLARTNHPHRICRLTPVEVPDLAARVQQYQDEPFGGLPTLAYARVFEQARSDGVIVLLDGQGLDEQWAGYDYYRNALTDSSTNAGKPAFGPVQGSRASSVHPECLTEAFRALAEPFLPPNSFPDALRNLQDRDARYTKIPRALRFNDRISMMSSTELREPFLDHRLFELAFRQPTERKISGPTHKVLLRQIAGRLLPGGVAEAPKRPLQTPQREWLRGSLKDWSTACIEAALTLYGGEWLDTDAVRREWRDYQTGVSDNSFYIWQWVNLGLGSGAV